jgi:hypothetical protein
MVEVTAPSLISSEVVEGFTALAMMDKEKNIRGQRSGERRERGCRKKG